MSTLLPEGSTSLRDVPYLWLDAVRFALVVLSFDELPSDERPPRRIWRDGERLKEWFDAVNKRREEKYGGDGGGSREIEDPVDNHAAHSLVVE